MSDAWDYDNRTGRGPGRTVRTLGLFVPGVRRVRGHVDPYADAWQADNRDALARPGRRVVVLGDSMAQGVGASSHRGGWAGRLAERLADLDVTLVNLSASGARVPDVLDQQLPAMDALPPTSGSDDPDLVVVMIGSNDLFGGPGPRTALPDRFAELLDRLPDGAVVTTLPQPRRAAGEVNALVEAAATAGRVHVVDLRTDGPPSWRGPA